jgi:hypothetical protein
MSLLRYDDQGGAGFFGCANWTGAGAGSPVLTIGFILTSFSGPVAMPGGTAAAAFAAGADAFTGAGAGTRAGAGAAAAWSGFVVRSAGAAVFAFTGFATDCPVGAVVSAAGAVVVCVSGAGAGVVAVESGAGDVELAAGGVLVSVAGGTLWAIKGVEVMARTAPSAVGPGRNWIRFRVIMKFNPPIARRWRH